MENKPVRVLFVCYANLCRSPMAEALFTDRVMQAGLHDQFHIDSAGVACPRRGEKPHRETLKLLAEHDIACSHISRPLVPDDLLTFTNILAVDNETLSSVWIMGRRTAKIEPLLRYAPATGLQGIPDPLITKDFDQTFELTAKAIDGLFAALCERHGLEPIIPSP